MPCRVNNCPGLKTNSTVATGNLPVQFVSKNESALASAETNNTAATKYSLKMSHEKEWYVETEERVDIAYLPNCLI